tara:strand:- start:452 stop:601 length:150 start_codon:yes stop_codon:yes gene_type:complete
MTGANQHAERAESARTSITEEEDRKIVHSWLDPPSIHAEIDEHQAIADG